MYGNINSDFAFNVASTSAITATPLTTGDVVLAVPGANPDTDIVTGIMVDPDVAFDIGYAALVSAWVSASNTVTLRYFNLVPNVTDLVIASGTFFKGKIERCDNGFKADGL